jgi:hypothetical protein
VDIDLGFGLWARLEPELEARIAKTIAGLARRFGGPVFPPHVTLAAGFQNLDDALAAARDAASSLTGLELRFHRVGGTPRFFRALYLCVEDDPRLSDCHAELVRRSGQSEATFVPHLSLFYGTLGELERALAMNDALGLLPLLAHLRAVEVWRLSGPADSWQCQGGVELPAR